MWGTDATHGDRAGAARVSASSPASQRLECAQAHGAVHARPTARRIRDAAASGRVSAEAVTTGTFGDDHRRCRAAVSRNCADDHGSPFEADHLQGPDQVGGGIRASRTSSANPRIQWRGRSFFEPSEQVVHGRIVAQTHRGRPAAMRELCTSYNAQWLIGRLDDAVRTQTRTPGSTPEAPPNSNVSRPGAVATSGARGSNRLSLAIGTYEIEARVLRVRQWPRALVDAERRSATEATLRVRNRLEQRIARPRIRDHRNEAADVGLVAMATFGADSVDRRASSSTATV